MKKILFTLFKISISLAILAYLAWRAWQDNAFANLWNQPKQWGLFLVAWLCCTTAVMTTFIRWHFLVRALGVPTRWNHSLRICFLGYLFNLAPLGIVGGDVIKAVMLARQHQNAQAKAAASVIVDRLIGLYMLFVVASIAILATGFWRTDNETVAKICSLTFWIAGVGAVGIGLMMIPAVSDGHLARYMERLPRVGRPIESLNDAMRMYQRRPGILLVSALMSMCVHGFFAAGVYFIARGLPGNIHSLGSHFVLSPLSAATGAVPLSVGPFEFVLDFLYTHVPVAGAAILQGQGLVVALGYRVITVTIAAVGACYYIGARQEVARAFEQSAMQPPHIAGGSTIAITQKFPPASAA